MNNLSGFININKDRGYSSFYIIRQLRKILKMKKIGHTGTLDPIAEGVMVTCLGKATKLASEIESTKKVYTAKMEFGYATPSYDSETEANKINENYEINEDMLKNVISEFVGKLEQIPPMYSAIKKDGKKLYELARKNIEIERKKRLVEIDYINIIEFDSKEAIIETKVSKGTYIRSLINDIGERLGSYATMVGLTREKVGEFSLKDSYKLDDIANMVDNNNYSFMITPEMLFLENDSYNLKSEREKHLFINGNTVIAENNNDVYKIYFENSFYGLGKIEDERLKGYKYFGEGV